MKDLNESTPVDATRTECYPVPKNGRVLILNISIDRQGSQLDVAKIKKTFNALGNFKIELRENFLADEIQWKQGKDGYLDEYASTIAKDKFDALFVFIMAHGGTKSALVAADGECFNFKKDILSRFCRETRPFIQHIPKIFVLNACRGDTKLSPSYNAEDDGVIIPGKMSHSIDNTIILFSTLEGFTSKRIPKLGSPCVQIVCDLISELSSTRHILDILTRATDELKITNMIAKGTQISEKIDYGWGKMLFLNQQAFEFSSRPSSYDKEIEFSKTVTNLQSEDSNGSNDSTSVEKNADKKSLQIMDLNAGQNIIFKRNNRKLLVRVLYKVRVETGEGKQRCLKFLFVDNSDGISEIEGIAFEETGVIIFKKLDIGCCVEITEALVQSKEFKYQNSGLSKNQLQLTFKNYHGVTKIVDQAHLPRHPVMKLTDLKEVKDMHHREIIDVLGRVTEIFDVKTTKNGNQYRTTLLQCVGDNTEKEEIPINLWENREKLNEGSIVYIRGLMVIKPSEIKDADDESKDQYDIQKDHYSVAQQSVITEIKEYYQLDPLYQEKLRHIFTNNDEVNESPLKKIKY